MRHLSIGRAAMSVGTVFAAWLAIGVQLAGLGWAESMLDFFIFELHFLKTAIQHVATSALSALSLIAITFGIGALLGGAFAFVWNWLTGAGETEWQSIQRHSRQIH